VENTDGNKLFSLHKDNWQMQSILPHFIDYYYGGDLEKAHHLISVTKNIDNYFSRYLLLDSLYKKMAQLDQLDTFEAFRIFTLVKSNLGDRDTEHYFRELLLKAPPCLQLLLWPKPAGAKFRLVNKFLKAPLYCVNTKVLCGIPPALCRDAQSWSAQVDPLTGLTTFEIEGNKESNRFLNGKTGAIPAGLCNNGTGWKVKAVDDHHVKLYADGTF
jgi:hypothetical protein